MRILTLGLTAAAALTTSGAPLAAADGSSLTAPMNAKIAGAVGTSAQTGSEVIQCRSYWRMWEQNYETLIPAAERDTVHEALQPKAVAKTLGWHDAKFDELWAGADAYRMQQRVDYSIKFKKEAEADLAKWKADPTNVAFFSWLASCSARD